MVQAGKGPGEGSARRRVPEFQVVIAFSQHASIHDARPTTNLKSGGQSVTPNATKVALLAESAQRLLWMYHHSLPALAAEARFDVGKLLCGFSNEGSEEDGDGEPDAVKRLDRVRRLHVIRLLKESDQFMWTGKLPGMVSASVNILPFQLMTLHMNVA